MSDASDKYSSASMVNVPLMERLFRPNDDSDLPDAAGQYAYIFILLVCFYIVCGK